MERHVGNMKVVEGKESLLKVLINKTQTRRTSEK